MKIDINAVEQIAILAKIELSNKEKTMYADQLSVIVDYIEVLNEIDTGDTVETSQITGLWNITRADTPKSPKDEIKKALINSFPDKNQNLLKVKAVFTEEE